MPTPLKFSLTTFTFFLFHLLHIQPIHATLSPDPAPAPAPSPSPQPTTNDTDTDGFIRTSCAQTRYPDVCYASLSGYANAVQRNQGQLARLAISVSLTRAQEMASYVSNVSRQGGVTSDNNFDRRTAAALHDCFFEMDDAVSEIRDSLQQMKQVASAAAVSGGSSKESFMFQMSNVQTWMSAALTNEDTCQDGFEEAPDGPTKSDIADRVLEVMMVTSNALALVNNYVNSYR